MNLINKIFKSPFGRVVGFFAASNLIAMVFNMVSGLLSARILGPEKYGLYNSVSIVLGYAGFVQLGALNGLSRQLPYYYGKNKTTRALLLCSVANWWATLLGIIFLIVLSAIGIYHIIIAKYYAGFTWITVGIAVFFFFKGEMYYKITYRTNSDFNKLSRINIIKSIVSLCSVTLVSLMGYIGFLFRNVIIVSSEFFLLFKNRPVRVKRSWSSKHFKHLIKIGLPILFVGYLPILWNTLDSTLVLFYLGAKQLGLYTVPSLVFSSLSIIPTSLLQILYPKLVREYGEGKTLDRMIKVSAKAGVSIFLILLPVCIIAWFIMPYMINLLLPKFMGGVEAGRWMLPLPLVMSLANVDQIFVVIKKPFYYGFSILCGIGVFMLSIFLFHTFAHLELKYFTMSMVIGRIVALIISYSFLLFNKNINSIKNTVVAG